jgi:hypothetical protein
MKNITVGNGHGKSCKQPHALLIRQLVVSVRQARDVMSMFVGPVRKIHSVSLQGVEFFTEGATFFKPGGEKALASALSRSIGRRALVNWRIEHITVELVDFEGPISRHVSAIKGWHRTEYQLNDVEGTLKEIAIRMHKDIREKAMQDLVGSAVASATAGASTLCGAGPWKPAVVDTVGGAVKRIKRTVAKGKVARGERPDGKYKFGDFFRGLFQPSVAASSAPHCEGEAPTEARTERSSSADD